MTRKASALQVLFSQWVLHGAFDGNNEEARARLSLDIRWHAADGGGYDPRYQGPNPLGTGGGGYGELNGARPLTETDLESVTLLSPAVIRRQQGWTAPNPG